jgi:hypothetical protein
MLSILLFTAMQSSNEVYFSPQEVRNLKLFWSKSGRLVVKEQDKYVVRLTPLGSQWLWDYNKKRGKSKSPPGQVPPPTNEQEIVWEDYINRAVNNDRLIAQNLAELENAKRENRAPIIAPSVPLEDAPLDLINLVGQMPRFASSEKPSNFSVNFDDYSVTYSDHVEMRPRYAYYRFSEGVTSPGVRMKTMPESDLNCLLSGANISASEAKVFKAISLLEGGFDSVNTYDTGFVSVGFIQFATLAEGGHSLGQVLLKFKTESPKEFASDFVKYGINVTGKGLVVAMDIEKARECVGPEANELIIKDKRLIAVFQRAGTKNGFRIAQLKVAKSLYWPSAIPVVINLSGKSLKISLSDVIKSEAGLAVFLDRKVNTGNLGNFSQALDAIIVNKAITEVSQLSKYEALLIRCLYYRFDPSKDETLSKPPECEMIPSVLALFGRK